MHCPKLQSCAISKKTNDANLRKWRKHNFRPNFGPFGTNLNPPPKFLLWVLPVLVVRNYSKLSSYATSRKTNQTSTNGEKPRFGPDFGWFGPNLSQTFFYFFFILPLLVARHCSKLSPYSM